MGLNENAQKWVEALRSGEFKQTRGVLRKRDGYCCLGVACEVYRRTTGDGEWTTHNDETGVRSFRVSGEGAIAILPPKVQNWLGLKTQDGAFDSDILTRLNDTGSSFTQIADSIQQNPTLFR